MTAPPPPRCDGIPTADAKRDNQSDEPLGCVWANAKKANIPAARQREDEISARKVIKPERREVFLFMVRVSKDSEVGRPVAVSSAKSVALFWAAPRISFCEAYVESFLPDYKNLILQEPVR